MKKQSAREGKSLRVCKSKQRERADVNRGVFTDSIREQLSDRDDNDHLLKNHCMPDSYASKMDDRAGSKLRTDQMNDMCCPEGETKQGTGVVDFNKLTLEDQVEYLMMRWNEEIEPTHSRLGEVYRRGSMRGCSSGTLVDDLLKELDLVGSSQDDPACPTFLFCHQPCVPWALRLDSLEESRSNKAIMRDDSEARDGCIEDAELAIQPLKKLYEDMCRHQIPAQLDQSDIRHFEDMLVIYERLDRLLQDKLLKGHLSCLPADAVLQLITSTVSSKSTHARIVTATRFFLQPTVQSLNEPPPAPLYAAVEHVGKVNPQALLEGCFIPLLQEETSMNNKYFSELLMKCIKGQALKPESVLRVVRDTSKRPVLWRQHTISILQCALETKHLQLHASDVKALISCIHFCATHAMKHSLKLAKLLVTIIKGWGKDMDESCILVARQAAQACGTFMSRTAQVALDALSIASE